MLRRTCYGKQQVLFVGWWRFLPSLYEELVFVAHFEVHFDEDGFLTFEREHAVFGQVFGQVYEEFSVFSSE